MGQRYTDIIALWLDIGFKLVKIRFKLIKFTLNAYRQFCAKLIYNTVKFVYHFGIAENLI